MEAKLKSVSTNQTLQLALKSAVAGISVFWLRASGFGFWQAVIFLFVIFFFYFRPFLQPGRFFPSILAVSVFPFIIPKIPGFLETIFVFGWGILFFSLLGAKNLTFLRRKDIYKIFHFIIIAALDIMFLVYFGFWQQILMFVAFLFLFREFYLTLIPERTDKLMLLATIESFLLVELAWMISFLSLSFFAGAAMLMLLTFLVHDIAIHHFERTISRELIMRNVVAFILLASLVFIFL